MKVNKIENLDFKFNEDVLQCVLCDISNAYLDLYNSIVEKRLKYSETLYEISKDITI